MRYYSYIATSLLLLLAIVLPLSAATLRIVQSPTIRELADNEEYMALVREREVLQRQSDSISDIMAQARRDFATLIENRDSLTTINRDSFSRHILSLEQQMFALRSRMGAVTNSLNDIEREWVMSHFNNPTPPVEQAPVADSTELTTPMDDTTTQESANQEIKIATRRNLMDNDCFAEALTAEDYAELRNAHNEELRMLELGDEYCATYDMLHSAAEAYMAATNEVTADSIFTRYRTLSIAADSLDDIMHRHWNHILDAKYYAYGYLLELNHNYDLLDSSAEEFNTMQQQCSANDGTYASDALMHYTIGHPTLLEYEIRVAEALGLNDARDSLVTAREQMPAVEYRHLPISIEERLFLDYAPIVIGRTNHYNNSNPLPELKIYERGTIYRILLGTFRSKQPMTLFKGVQPLAIAQDDEGKYCYYAGGFATRTEADEARLFLLDKGFKAPQICVWKDGEMTNISAETESDDAETPVAMTGVRYTIQIETEQIDDTLRELIESIAAGKSLSRANGRFILGTFTSHSEADVIVSVLSESYPELNIGIEEIELN